ncbi:MAG: serine/threonine-protein phosphatase [Bryobacteraceae bacterium]|nr:serine/threonine-protein phosphatase [Bryobacteraceae bacterium]
MLEAYGLSDRGCVRQNNEDCYLVEPEFGLYLVADGMGGAQAGERASKVAADTVLEVVARASDGSAELLREAFEEANRRVLEVASTDPTLTGMGTTLVSVLDCEDHLEVASVGDSRCYYFLDGELSLVTTDQTWVQEVGRRLGINEDQLRYHPMRHVLTMAIGASTSLKVNTSTIPKQQGLQLLLSSDGLHGVVPQETIAQALGSERSLADKCHYLIEAARKAGGPDNITAVLLRVPQK